MATRKLGIVLMFVLLAWLALVIVAELRGQNMVAVEDCETKLSKLETRYAQDFNSYMNQYHIHTVSANPKEDKKRQEKMARLDKEWSELRASECF
jgi:hypothetical protein